MATCPKSDIDKKIAERMLVIRQRKIWQRLNYILNQWARVEREEKSDHIRLKGEITVPCPESDLRISMHTFGQFHENKQIEVSFILGAKVFSATATSSLENVDLRRVLRLKGERIVVDLFYMGNWVNHLQKGKVSKILSPRKQKVRTPKPEPFRQSDAELKAVFDIP